MAGTVYAGMMPNKHKRRGFWIMRDPRMLNFTSKFIVEVKNSRRQLRKKQRQEIWQDIDIKTVIRAIEAEELKISRPDPPVPVEHI